MASISYWFLSPSFFVALLGKLKGWDRTTPTPAFDWRKATLDLAIPAKNEAGNIALCLTSVFQQEFSPRKVTVIDDGSTDGTSDVVRQFCQLTGHSVELITREKSIGKTPSVREVSKASDADALMVLDADTVLADRDYISRSVEELFKNAGVASVCGEVMPFTRRRRHQMAGSDAALRSIQWRFGAGLVPSGGRWQALLEFFTVMYRTTLYTVLQRVVYEGHMKLFGSRLNPIGCAVTYKMERLRECFAYAVPMMGDNLSNSEDIFIGHFFAWKGYRNVQVTGVKCESIEPTVVRLPKQLYLWSSAFLQSLHYFKELPLSPLKQVKAGLGNLFHARKPAKSPADHGRRIQEQYRAPWGEAHTRKFGRALGWADLLLVFEKITYPFILLYLALFNHEAFWITIGLEAVLSTASVFVIADSGARLKSAGMMLAATPIRLLSLGVDLFVVG
ncbi:MAG TPA: glycosyltransferase family 2 protein, partial [Bryobacterales bacterium]|nr:glycosyltransferase family 2 protein [Bryobacterales bacterium]